MTPKWLQVLYGIAALGVAVFFFVAAWVTWQARSIPLHINGVLTRAEGVESKLNASAINLDKATAAWSASAKAQSDAVTDLATDARGSISAVDLTLASLRSNSDAVNRELASLKETTDAATTLTAALAKDAGTANDTIQKAQPLLEAYTRSGNDLDALLKDKAIHATVENLATTSGNIAGITGSVDKMTAHLEKNVDSPRPLWKTMIPMGEDGAKIWACIFQHVCVN